MGETETQDKEPLGDPAQPDAKGQISCAWCGKVMEPEKAHMEYPETHEATCSGECDKQFRNDRGLE